MAGKALQLGFVIKASAIWPSVALGQELRLASLTADTFAESVKNSSGSLKTSELSLELDPEHPAKSRGMRATVMKKNFLLFWLIMMHLSKLAVMKDYFLQT